jgi:hypothetical protein
MHNLVTMIRARIHQSAADFGTNSQALSLSIPGAFP